MLTVYLGVRLQYRECSMLNALGAAALALMLADPKVFLGASFQLTFLTIFLVAAIAVPLLERTSQPYKRGLRHLDSLEFDRTVPRQVAQLRLDADARGTVAAIPELESGEACANQAARLVRSGNTERLRVALCLDSDATRNGTAHGALLSSRHRDGNPRERAGCPLN